MLAGNPTFHIIHVSLYVLKLFAIKITLGESVATACRKCLEQVGSAEMKHFASVVVGQLENILTTPSGGVKHTDVWIKYHQLRLSESIRRACMGAMRNQIMHRGGHSAPHSPSNP